MLLLMGKINFSQRKPMKMRYISQQKECIKYVNQRKSIANSKVTTYFHVFIN